VDITAPELLSAISLDGFRIEMFFSEEVADDAALVDTASYSLSDVDGAPTTLLSVAAESFGPDGVLSVILTHTGTTLGGTYSVGVVGGITDVSGNPIIPASVNIFTLGDPTPFTVTPISGTELLVVFQDTMLTPGAGSTIDLLSSYGLTQPAHPVVASLTGITHPYLADNSQVLLTIEDQTNLEYTLSVSPALAFEYDGSVLPDAATGFTGVEVNPTGGTSTIVSNKLSMDRPKDDFYGWAFQDTSGIITPLTSTLRFDFSFDAAAVYTPALSTFIEPIVGTLTVEDGPIGVGVMAQITLKHNASGNDAILVESDDFSDEVEVAWSTPGTNVLSAIRNRKAGFWTFLFNGRPFLTTIEANIDELASIVGGNGGASWVFSDESFDIEGFKVCECKFTATDTVFSGSWNFLHDELTLFTGSGELGRKSFFTKRGPLVKGWGDATPATNQDVVVRVDGTPVEVEEVNPYIGKVTLAVALPLKPPATAFAVEVDYKWFQNPIFEVGALNVDGCVLNQWDRDRDFTEREFTPTYHPRGAHAVSRFPMSLVLGPLARPEPRLIGHRYLGFEKEYSALLNDATTLLLNVDPHRSALPTFERSLKGVSEAYEGLQAPPSATPSWTLVGTDTGTTNVGEGEGGLGTYTLIDAQSGAYDPDNPTTAYYYRDADLTFPSSLFAVARLSIDASAVVADGVFTGVSFGVHNNLHLYLVGALLINDVHHVGLLLDATRPHEQASWSIGPTTMATAESQTTLTVDTVDIPPTLSPGDRFQVLTGNQAGAYTISAISAPITETRATLTIEDPGFVADVNLYGNKYPDITFEMRWDDLVTYRLEVDPDTQTGQLTVSGANTGTVVTLDGTTGMPQPAQTSLLLTFSEKGQVFWGSLSREATNASTWSFFRYGVVPDQATETASAIRVESEMSVLPQLDPGNEWFTTQTFGTSFIDTTGDVMVLKSDSASETLKFLFGYSRVEPFLTDVVSTELLTTFRLDSGNLGAGDAQVVINNSNHHIVVATLIYRESAGPIEYRRFIEMPSISMAGILDPAEQGWSASAPLTLGVDVQNDVLVLTQESSGTGGYFGSLDLSGIDFTDTGDRIIEARFAVKEHTPGVDDYLGVMFGADVGIGTFRFVGMALRADPADPGVHLITTSSTVVTSYDFDWTDGEQHTYRIVVSGGATVTLFIDDVIQLPTVSLALFSGGAGNTASFFGALNTDGTGTVDDTKRSVVEWSAVSIVTAPPADAKRTIGVWKGGDFDHINSWEIPRTDSSTAPNSAEVGPAVEEMDWRTDMEVRVLYDPEWGATVFRPDLPLPPYYVPEDPNTPGTGHATVLTEPSAGWINVESPNLPKLASTCGFVSFGALDARAITQQRWDSMRYRIFRHPLEDVITPRHMVLNQANVISSGELTQDKVAETVIVQTTSATTLSLRPTHLNASYVIKVVDEGKPVGEQILTPDLWVFNKTYQTITLGEDSEGVQATFSGDKVPVTVVFKPGKPITSTYLQIQPLLDSTTLLNEGTPPIPKSQILPETRGLFRGSDLVPGEPLGEEVTGSTGAEDFRFVEFDAEFNDLYESMSFYQVDNDGETGLITSICEGLIPEGFSGFQPGEGGDTIYEQGGGGAPLGAAGWSAGLTDTGTTVGSVTGGHVLELSGPPFVEERAGLQAGADVYDGPFSGACFVPSGSGFLGPVLPAAGTINNGSVLFAVQDPVPGPTTFFVVKSAN